MKSNLKCNMASIATLLLLAVFLSIGLQIATAAENVMTMRVSMWEDFGLDPTVSDTLFPGEGGITYPHHFTHQSPLITLDGEGKIIPWMTESYEVSDDYKTITFHLRKGIKFADGTPLNASILKFNFDRIITYGWADQYGTKGTSAKLNPFIYYDNSEAPDKYTFKIHFVRGWLDVARELASSVIYSNFISPFDVKPAWDIKGILKLDKKYNGLGPYYVDENETIPKEKTVLKKRHCWRDDLNFHKTALDKIVEVVIPDSNNCVLAMEKCVIDYTSSSGMTQESLLTLQNNPKMQIETRTGTGLRYILTAYWKEPFNSTDGILLRKAICYALNRSEIAKGASYGYAVPATKSMALSPLYPDIPECCQKGYDYDLEKAKQLLAEAGWKDSDGDGILDKNGRSLKNLDFILTSYAPYVWTKDTATIVQSQLKNVGIGVKFRTLEWGAYKKATKDGDFDLRMGFGDPISTAPIEQMAMFDLRAPDRKNAYSNQNRTLEKYVENARTATSIVERDQNLCRACDILYDEAGIIPLVYPMEFAVVSSKVKGFEFGASLKLDHIEECWIGE